MGSSHFWDMIAVANSAETYKPQLQEGSGRVQVIRVILIVSSTEAVTLKIDPSVVLATRKYVDDAVIEVKAYADDVMKKHVAAANPHKQYPLIANALKEMVDAGLVNQVLQNLGLGEAAKRNVGTGANQIPDMSAYSSGSGWQKLPDGSIEQWGRINFPTNAAAVSTNVTFPIPFTQEPDVVIVYDGGFGGGNMWGATNWTRTGFVAHCNYGFEGGAFFAKGR